MGALTGGAMGTPDKPVNRSRGCGGIMRVAPVALWDPAAPILDADLLGAKAAATTHGHPLGYMPAAALVHVVRRVADKFGPLGAALEDAKIALKQLFPDDPHLEGLLATIARAQRLAANADRDEDNIPLLGAGWAGDEALGIALYCCLRHEDDFAGTIVSAVNHGGDSDSTGAVAGNIAGAQCGYAAIPREFKEKLELREVILEIADDLCRAAGRADGGWLQKYKSVKQ